MSLDVDTGRAGMSRIKAFGIHLSLSLVVLLGLALVMLTTWYQNGLWIAAQADRLLLIVAAVDIVVGPALTLLVFRPHKPGLHRDLSIIVLIQLSFLFWGLHAVWFSRPVYLVALPHQFVLVTANEIPDSDTNSPRPEVYRDLPWFAPKIVAARLPDDPDQANYVVLQAMQGRDLTAFPEHYIPFEEMSSQLIENSHDLASLDNVHGTEQPLPTHRSRKLQEAFPNARWVPLASRRGNFVAIIDVPTAQPLRIIERPAAASSDR